MHEYLMPMLVCPTCHAELSWEIASVKNEQILEALAKCEACGATYPIRDGIGLFLTPDLPREDMWEGAQGGLIQYLEAHPEILAQLLDSPLADLNPVDQFYRAMLLDSRADFQGADEAEQASHAGAYTAEYLSCWGMQVEYVIEALAALDPQLPILDLASGRGYLVRALAGKIANPIIVSDFSPRVLRRNRLYFEHLGLRERTSLLAFDARKTPFRSASIQVMTTNLGLPNVENPDRLVVELARITHGVFRAISHFYPPDDHRNLAALKERGLEKMLLLDSALEEFHRAGWQVSLENRCSAVSDPTPTSRLIPEAGLDTFPVAATVLDWGVLVARRDTQAG